MQVMLRQDNGEYACIAEDEKRYNLGEAKEELMSAMGLDTEVEGSAMQFLRRGYKVGPLCPAILGSLLFGHHASSIRALHRTACPLC